MTVRSMTGFGAAEGDVAGVRVSVEIRTVNHRFFSPAFKLPASYARWERELREALQRRIRRGHVTLSARVAGEAGGEPRIDETRFTRYLEQLRSLAAAHHIATPVDVASVLRLPQVVISDDGQAALADPGELLAVVERAVESLDEMRATEGARLRTFIEERLDAMERAMTAVAGRAPERLVAQRDRLRAAVRELTEGVAVDEQRVAQEIAILADRLDVSEEIQRFGAHLAAFRATLHEPPPDGAGKRLGFLLQELLREGNTTGSKANDAAMLAHVISIKEDLERVREQVENLE